MKPFSEDARPEQGNGSDPFYATGSIGSIGDDPGSFRTSLSNKEQIRLSFAVKNKVQMLPNSSSIYYFNTTAGQWNIPSKALSDHVGPTQNVSFGNTTTNGSVFIEDVIGFDCRGNAVISGSLSIHRNLSDPENPVRAQKIEDSQAYDASSISRDSQSDYMSRDFPKSVQRNPDYSASSSETFTLPISDPFLIEKVVFEIPFCFGNGWFYDKTSLNFVTSSAGDYTLNGVDTGLSIYWLLDQGGPGITLSLSSQKNYGTGSIRDLICHSLITHEEDLNREVNLTKNFNTWHCLTINGIDEGDVECIVTPLSNGSNNYFTGSIQVKSISKISNGISSITVDKKEGFASSLEITEWITNKISTKYTRPSSVVLTGIDTFGRGMTGFAPSGGSIFGGEYTTDQTTLRKDGSIKNDLYISDTTKRSIIIGEALLIEYPPSKIVSLSNTYFKSSKVSPYLIYPGEKLILAASKTRPALKTVKVDIKTSTNPDAETKGIGALLSSSYINSIPCTPSLNGHDVQFNTGSINITFYGSYVRGGNSYIP